MHCLGVRLDSQVARSLKTRNLFDTSSNIRPYQVLSLRFGGVEQSGDMVAIRFGRKTTLSETDQKLLAITKVNTHVVKSRIGMDLGGDGAQAVIWALEEAVPKLIADGANVDAQDSEGETALMGASRTSQYGAMKHLIRANADLNITDNLNRTALIHAVISKNKEAVRVLMTEGVGRINLDQQDQYGMTALMYAAHDHDSTNLKALIAAGAKLDLQDDKGWTALMHAVYYRYKDNIEALLKAEADVTIKNNHQKTAWQMANESFCSKDIEALFRQYDP